LVEGWMTRGTHSGLFFISLGWLSMVSAAKEWGQAAVMGNNNQGKKDKETARHKQTQLG
jgi:hypothetical protein